MIWIRRLRLTLLVLASVVLQTTIFSEGLRIFGVTADVGLVLTIAVAYYAGPETGTVYGFFSGLAVDCFLQTPMGLSALSFAIVGYGVGYLQSGLVRSTRWIAPIMGGLGALVGGGLFILLAALVGQDQLFALEEPEGPRDLHGLRRPARVRRVSRRPLGHPSSRGAGPRLARRLRRRSAKSLVNRGCSPRATRIDQHGVPTAGF